MARRSSGLFGFSEQEQLLSNVIESEDASKCYSFPSALIISEVPDIEQLFSFSSGQKTSSPVNALDSVPQLQSSPQSRFFPLHGHPRELFCFRFVLHALLHLQNLIQFPK